jgi:hypothetical protein
MPFDRPGTPVFIDRLGEIRADELGAGIAPLRIVVTQNHHFRRAWMIAAMELIDLAADVIEGVATVVLEEGNSRQSEQLGGSIESIAALEALPLRIWISASRASPSRSAALKSATDR